VSGKRVLVLGGSSYLGRRLVEKLGPERALATYCQQPLPGGVCFDALNMNLANLPINQADFSHAVVLMGDAKPDSCAANPERSWHLNVTRTKAVLDELIPAGMVPVFASTESVFDGDKGNYREDEPANPVLVYGRQKREIERYLEENAAAAITVRLARLYSIQPGDGTLLNAWLDELEANRPIRCAANQVLSPVEVDDAAAAIVALIDHQCQGVFHVATAEPWSRLAILKALIGEYQRFADYRGQVEECSIDDFPAIEPRPRDTSLNPAKLVAATGFEPKPVAACCRLLTERKYAYDDRRVAV